MPLGTSNASEVSAVGIAQSEYTFAVDESGRSRVPRTVPKDLEYSYVSVALVLPDLISDLLQAASVPDIR